jgi:hypothetical protein
LFWETKATTAAHFSGTAYIGDTSSHSTSQSDLWSLETKASTTKVRRWSN